MNIYQDFKFFIHVLGGNRQGRHIEIPLLEQSKESPGVWVLEDEEICFKLVAPQNTESPILWISDLPKPPSDYRKVNNRAIYTWHPESRGANRYQAFFLNCFGSCQMDIEIRRKGGDKQWIELAPFEVRAKKISAERLREMIVYLSAHIDDLAGGFSVTKIAAGQTKAGSRVARLLKEAEDGLSLFEDHLPILIARHRTRLVPRRVVHVPGPGDYFDANTAEWLLSHLDMLTPAADMNDAITVIDNLPYTVEKLEVNELTEESDVYENRVLCSYLNSIKTFLVEIRKECEQAQIHERAGRKYYEEDADRYVSFSIEIKSSVRELFKVRKAKCDTLLEKCNYLVRVMDIRIPVTRFLSDVPSLTPWVKANLHYRILFEKIIFWYQMATNDWSNEEALVGIRSIDELYEYFCLYKLIDALDESGFRLEESEDRGQSYKTGWNSEYGAPRRTYEFRKGATRLVLHYEKEIWSPQHRNIETEQYMNVEGWIWDSYRKKGQKRTGVNSKRVPDYIFEISREQDAGENNSTGSVLAVFDAKYSSPDTVFFEKLPMLVMRYVHGISGKKGGPSPVISLYLLHPKAMDEDSEMASVRSFYTDDYDLFGEKTAIPALGTAEIDPASTWTIATLIQRITEVAEDVLSVNG